MKVDIQKIRSQYKKRFNDYSIDVNFTTISRETNLIIVIPCYKEEAIIDTLISLSKCKPANKPVLVLIYINSSEDASTDIKKFNNETFKGINTHIKNIALNNLTFQVFINNNLPKKHAGVGYARKTLMDTALKIFSTIEKDGIIVNTDADCLFTSNYFVEIEKAFKDSNIKHGVINFEHRIASEKKMILAKGIAEYELHLRYYKQALEWSNYPNVIHTIGSCMLCRASTYALEGGMNKRKAGEDFYFMNKLAKSHKFIEVNNASVLPSCRTSDRVPFGTGKAMNDYIENETSIFQTYNFKCFDELKKFIDNLELIYDTVNFMNLESNFNKITFNFLKINSIDKHLEKMKKQSKSFSGFKKIFFYWFDHLKALQFIHYYTEHKYKKVGVNIVAQDFLLERNVAFKDASTKSLLNKYRLIDKTNKI